MAVTFVETKKRQRLLLLALLALLFVIAGVVWWGFFARVAAPRQAEAPSPRKIQVDTSILSHPVLEELEEPTEPLDILPEVGRGNPFLPAQQNK